MPADRLLNTLLQLYQDVHDDAKTEQIIGTTTHLLTQLSNPLNLGVLTSQLLTAPAIWMRPGGLRTSLRIISIYNSAAMRVHQLQNDIDVGNPLPPNEAGGGLRCDEWARAAAKGADDRSNRWQHLLVLTGILLGMESNDRRGLSRGLRNTLGQAVATAANLALQTAAEEGPLAQGSVVLALNFAFPLLGEHHRNQINCNALLPAAVWALVSEEGFADGQFLIALARDTVDTLGQGISWSPQSPSFQELLMVDKSPLMANMGPLSKLASFAAERATETGVVLQAHNDLLTFSHRVLNAWARTRFSDVDPALESTRLSRETLEQTWPALWQVLRKVMFGTVALLQAIVSRSLLDPYMLHDTAAPGIASVSLQILRNLYFISSRNGNGAFQVYEFAYLASLDNITRNSKTCESFLADFRTAEGLTLPSGFLQRTLDLFYLNVAEHMPLVLSTEACDALIIKPATSYLSLDGPMTPAVVQIFESSHSAILAVMTCPQHSRLTIELAPFYIVKLFESFPHQISPRQFRLAFKTVIQIVSPPFPIASLEPHLSETLLEMLLAYAANAATAPLPQSEASLAASEESGGAAPESAQSALILTLIDALPFLPLVYMEEWLTVAAKSLNSIADPRLRQPVRDRFWDILVNGEMDVERAAVGVAWWGTKGGREMVLQGAGSSVPLMSGAIVTEDKASRL